MTIEINNIAGIVRSHAATQPTKVALVQGDKTQTWGQLYERSCKVANALKLAGVGPQDRVAFLDKNGIDHFEVFYA
jgi:long-chain acyl-CoA synthetase